ncbi:hypothetical protein [Hyphomicrobium sp. CS1GBMeth3]|uniref:hypothetical protein n=1 Tax=Hyphomicrobium sp. CS1GBMeth3 TaxID=1892845 RepID=UPI0011150197|nr:hypothetical protein [Hyphomicrobium sp. CS1GBMeth3]
MLRDYFKPMSGSVLAAGVAICTFTSGLALATTGAAAEEITITVTKFQALDKADELSNGDFFARMRVAGKAAFSPVLSGQQEFTPNWKLTLPIAPGKQTVNLALIDKDVSVDDPIDINRLPGKRDLDFTVDTKTGRIEGFAESYKVGQTITRAGAENKKASISFKVDVKK